MQAATGLAEWLERWERLVEAIDIIHGYIERATVSRITVKYYTAEAKLYDPPPQPIPILTAANGRKSMRLAGPYADGLITHPLYLEAVQASNASGGA